MATIDKAIPPTRAAAPTPAAEQADPWEVPLEPGRSHSSRALNIHIETSAFKQRNMPAGRLKFFLTVDGISK